MRNLTKKTQTIKHVLADNSHGDRVRFNGTTHFIYFRLYLESFSSRRPELYLKHFFFFTYFQLYTEGFFFTFFSFYVDTSKCRPNVSLTFEGNVMTAFPYICATTRRREPLGICEFVKIVTRSYWWSRAVQIKRKQIDSTDRCR